MRERSRIDWEAICCSFFIGPQELFAFRDFIREQKCLRTEASVLAFLLGCWPACLWLLLYLCFFNHGRHLAGRWLLLIVNVLSHPTSTAERALTPGDSSCGHLFIQHYLLSTSYVPRAFIEHERCCRHRGLLNDKVQVPALGVYTGGIDKKKETK